MIKRYIGLYLEYLITKVKYRKNVKFNGFTIVHAFSQSSVKFMIGGEKTTINSSFLSNMVGLS